MDADYILQHWFIMTRVQCYIISYVLHPLLVVTEYARKMVIPYMCAYKCAHLWYYASLMQKDCQQ